MTRRYNIGHEERKKKFRAMKWRACITGKIPFSSRREARVKARESTRRVGSAFDAYLCDKCERWHIGRAYETQTEAERSEIVRRYYGID